MESVLERPAGRRRFYGERVEGVTPDGLSFRAGVFNENAVRAAAGMTMAMGAVAFVYAYFAEVYMPIQAVTTFFFIEFLLRVMMGLQFSPLGWVARWMTSREPPHWVSARPKRFAWSIGVAMSLAMMLITNSGIRGPLPLTICLICLALMWMEAVLGLCLGCEIHRLLVRRGWVGGNSDFEVCTHGACAVELPGKGERS